MATATKTARTSKRQSRRSASLAAWRRDATRKMLSSRRATLALFSRISEDDILRPATFDRWSAKDVLAHLLSCDEETARRLDLIERGRADRIRWFTSMADADRFNAKSVRRYRSLGPRDLLRQLQRVTAELVDRLKRLPPEALDDASHEYTVVDWLPAPGWHHVDDHTAEIRAWWRDQHRARSRRPRRLARTRRSAA